MRFNIFFMFSLIFVFSLSSIEVGGHLTENTTWSPDNNPYLVTSVVYVESGVTLTIMPGTIIKFNDALFNYINNDEFWYNNGEEPLVKYIKCYGKIVAEGTEQDSIIFTRMHDIDNYHWGTIYLKPNSNLSTFKHCHFEYSAFIGISMMEQPEGALVVDNGFLKAENCSFIDNIVAIKIEGYSYDILIKDCDFQLVGPLLSTVNYKLIWSLQWNGFEANNILVAHNTFNTRMINSDLPVYFVYNSGNCTIDPHPAVHLTSEVGNNYIFKNTFDNYPSSISDSHQTNPIYIKSNQITTGGSNGIYLHESYVEISDNYLIDCGIYLDIENTGKVYNNFAVGGCFRVPGYHEVFNNISLNGDDVGVEVSWRNISCYNNLAFNNEYAIGSGGTVTYYNTIIIQNEELNHFSLTGNPVFRNSIIDFPLDPPLIDGGGNIWVDSLQAYSIFEDIQNGDFHLATGSIAIDTGFDTLGYYYPFDMDFNHRVCDGDNNGTAIIDIGPYEYGSPALGGIEGITYDPVSGNFVDYVLIKINNEPGEFTFSDSIGSYQYKLPAGIYDVHAERVFYDDTVEYQISVIDGQFTQLDIPMCETVDIQNYEIIPIKNDFNLNNYPNPFNPATIISFSIQDNSDVELLIFNIKGQKVTTLIKNYLSKGKHSIIWTGSDQNGIKVSSGIYYYKLKISGKTETVKKCLLLK